MIFGRITVGEGLAPPEMKLSVIGNAVKEQLLSIHNRYKNVTIENYVIMPNHLHMIMRLENPCDYSDSADKCSTQLDTLHDIICSFKSLATRSCRQIGFNNPVWQRSYFEHIIRNEDDYKNVGSTLTITLQSGLRIGTIAYIKLIRINQVSCGRSKPLPY